MIIALHECNFISIRDFIKYITIILKREKDKKIAAYKAEVFNSYVCDSLQIIGKNTATYSGGGYIKVKYLDIIKKVDKKQDTTPPKSAEEIIANTLAKAGLKMKKE